MCRSPSGNSTWFPMARIQAINDDDTGGVCGGQTGESSEVPDGQVELSTALRQ